MVEGARLESEYTAKPYRGFESLPLRQSCVQDRSRNETVGIDHLTDSPIEAIRSELEQEAETIRRRHHPVQSVKRLLDRR